MRVTVRVGVRVRVLARGEVNGEELRGVIAIGRVVLVPDPRALDVGLRAPLGLEGGQRDAAEVVELPVRTRPREQVEYGVHLPADDRVTDEEQVVPREQATRLGRAHPLAPTPGWGQGQGQGQGQG